MVTTTDPGTASVPISSILDALEGVLSDAERTALFEQLVGLRPAGVAPGDLITAELFNQVMSDINSLMIRVASLEGASGGPVIDHIEPQGGDKPAASRITIVGSNFRPDDLGTIVSFGDIKISDFFPESDETHIMVPVPISFTTLPADVPVSVTCNGKQSNAVMIHVVAQVVVPTGTISVHYEGAALGQINANQTYNLVWRVLSLLNVDRSLTLTPVISNVSGASTLAQWQAGVKLAVNAPITLKPGDFQDIAMTVKVPAAGGQADIGLMAESTTDSFEGQAPTLSFITGKTTAVSDTRAQVDPAAFVATDDLRIGNITVDGQTVSGFKMHPSKTLNLPMQVSTKAGGGGFYRFEATVEAAVGQDNRWTPAAIPTALALADNVTQPFSVPMTSAALADTTTVSYVVVTAKCFADQNAPDPKFISFARVPIVGKA